MNPIYVAIDTPDVHRAAALARDVRGLVGGVKLGLEFFCANGHEGVLRIAEGDLPIFLDLKLHDIPNTVGKAVEALALLEPAILPRRPDRNRAEEEEYRIDPDPVREALVLGPDRLHFGARVAGDQGGLLGYPAWSVQ